VCTGSGIRSKYTIDSLPLSSLHDIVIGIHKRLMNLRRMAKQIEVSVIEKLIPRARNPGHIPTSISPPAHRQTWFPPILRYNVDYEGHHGTALKDPRDRMSDAEFKQFLEDCVSFAQDPCETRRPLPATRVQTAPFQVAFYPTKVLQRSRPWSRRSGDLLFV
jgi:hypothetical protein